MQHLRELLTKDDATAAAVVSDFSALVEKKVEEQSGISGKLIKGALSTAKKVDSDIVNKASRRLLPEMADELDPYWQKFQEPGAGHSFGAYLEENSDEVVASIMTVADRNADKASAAPLKKVYSSVRGKSEKLITESLFDAGEIIHKHAS
ncbi:DUF6918 family protein [Corynebacterium ciconiae]|uniref:DUF6918 family protein n=1 Tax=Corynebacterium ciconiae TaxID=227319 RepID=UPI0003690FC5|nr:hypothetical protein [Corynebacterium ciconiae]